MTSARVVAVEVLHRSRSRIAFVSELIDQLAGSLALADRRLVVQLVMGVIRSQATLDALIRSFLTRPFTSLHPYTLDLLRLGVYQLVFLAQVPKHAAVHETVEITPPVVKKFVNAILRKVADVVTDKFTPEMGPASVPLTPGGEGFGVKGPRYRRLSRPLLPDPLADPRAYLTVGFSWPRWLADLWYDRFGWDECVRLGFWFNTPPPLWLRVNSLHGTRAEYLAQLQARGVAAEPGEHPQSVRLPNGGTVTDLPGYSSGAFAVQDHTSMLVASALDPQPGWQVLDLCAAPGGKTTHLAELMRNSGRIVACDIVPARLNTVVALCRRMGVTIVEPVLLADDADAPAGPFDAVLLDVPCSNMGVLGRRPEVRWRLDPREFPHLVRLQSRLLQSARDRVKPGGVVVYSTCSVEPDENGGVVRAILPRTPGLVLEAEHTSVPGLPSDGGYWARLRQG
jgi:16S rRNA (cytosine967-C5)-methyltransferase